MKKVLLVVLAIAIATPAMAAVTLTGTSTGLTATVGYSWDGTGKLPRAFGLTVTATGGKIASVQGYKTDGASTAASKGFGIFPKGIVIDAGGNATAYGSPVEPNSLPGGGAADGSSYHCIVALGSLYAASAPGDAPAASGTLFTVTCATGATQVVITPETTYRGGVVGEDANGITVAAKTIAVGAVLEAIKSTAPEYATWVAWGKPNCWAYKKQCNGDITGTSALGKPVSTADLNILKPAFGASDSALALVTNGICADLNHAAALGKRVSTADLNVLKTYFGVAETSVPVCPSTNINFWTN
jgi:hypothetical protein